MANPLTESARAALRDYITHDHPFGPTDASLITTHDSTVLGHLFDRQNMMYRKLRKCPSLILGRRGSGKTAFLQSSHTSGHYNILLELKSHSAFERVIQQIEPRLPLGVFAEAVADLWETMFFCALFADISHKYGGGSLAPIRDYLGKIGIKNENTPDTVLWIIVNTLAEKAKDGYVGAIAEVLRQTAGTSYSEAKECALAFMVQNNLKAILLLDSLERFDLEVDAVSHTLKGLLKCVGRFNSARSRFHIQFCLPSELYHRFMEISVSPLKDFGNKVTLQWHAKELLSIAAHRILIYLSLEYPSLYESALKHSPDTHEGARSIFQMIFPPVVRNSLGFDEDSISYLLRHTQLLPRHFLIYMNEILQVRARNDNAETVTEFPVSSEDVVSGVRSIEDDLCEEVFSAFLPVYPKVRAVCERCIPELPPVFTVGALQRVFNRHGKKALGSDDFYDFKKLLIETGIIGRVISDTNRYVQGLFEYTVPHRLVTSTSDALCIHPVFQKIFQAQSWSNATKKAIYPYGTDLETPDLRDHE